MHKFCRCTCCGKSTLAVRLSWELGLPIFSNDPIRAEISAGNGGILDKAAYKARLDFYFARLVSKDRSFILDSSADRYWGTDGYLQLQNAGFEFYIISFDLSKPFVGKMRPTGKPVLRDELVDKYFDMHQTFLENHGSEIDLHITDSSYPERFELCLNGLNRLIG